MAPGFQQTSGSKEAIANLRKGHIQKLNLRYTQVSHQELRCLPCATQGGPGGVRDCVSPQFNPPLSTCGHSAEYTGSLGTQGLGVRWEPLSSAGAPGHKHFPPGVAEKVSGYQRGASPAPHSKAAKDLCPLPRDYASWNLSVNLYTVNAPWLFSLLWCAGVPSVTSDNSHTLSRVPSPLWIMVSWRL